MTRRAHEHDYVELLANIDGHGRGVRGAIVSEDAETALVELDTEALMTGGLPARDLLDDLISVPYSALQVIEAGPATAR